MRKLTKEQLARKKELAEQLEVAVARLKDIIEEAEGFRQEVYDSMEEYYVEKSERWQEGDNGVAYTEWMNQWDYEVCFDEEVFEDFSGLPESVNG